MSEGSTIDNKGLRPLALLAAGKTGADIERIVREARASARRQKRSLQWTDLEALLTRDVRHNDPALALRLAVHEIGHAIAYTVTGIGRVNTISVIDIGGAMVNVTVDRTKFQDEPGLLALIACLLAGRAAEKLVFGEAVAGSGGGDESDLARSTRLAFDMETTLGLSEDQPLLHRAVGDAGQTLLAHPDLAEKVNARLEAAEGLAKSLLSEHAALLPSLAVRLVDARVIDGDDIRAALDADDLSPTNETCSAQTIP